MMHVIDNVSGDTRKEIHDVALPVAVIERSVFAAENLLRAQNPSRLIVRGNVCALTASRLVHRGRAANRREGVKKTIAERFHNHRLEQTFGFDFLQGQRRVASMFEWAQKPALVLFGEPDDGIDWYYQGTEYMLNRFDLGEDQAIVVSGTTTTTAENGTTPTMMLRMVSRAEYEEGWKLPYANGWR